MFTSPSAGLINDVITYRPRLRREESGKLGENMDEPRRWRCCGWTSMESGSKLSQILNESTQGRWTYLSLSGAGLHFHIDVSVTTCVYCAQRHIDVVVY